MSTNQVHTVEKISYFTVEQLCHNVLQKLNGLLSHYKFINDETRYIDIKSDIVVVESIYLLVYPNELSILVADYQKLLNYTYAYDPYISDNYTDARDGLRQAAYNIRKQVSLLNV